MAKGDVTVRIKDLTGAPMPGRIQVDFTPTSGVMGAGGEAMTVSVVMRSETDLTVTGIYCAPGIGTQYRVTVSTPHHRRYSFFQTIKENRVNTAHDHVEFWVQPGEVRDIRAPSFEDLPEAVRRILNAANMRAVKKEDRDLVGFTGEALCANLGPLRKACLLNVVKKASHESAAACLPFIEGVLVLRQDRMFAFVASSLPERLRESPMYRSAPNDLHEPLPGFEMTEGSFKTHPDPHANLQVTFMRETLTGRLAADIDLDESSGIKHGFEVIRNAVFRRRTNPYLIREFMLISDLTGRSLDPGYRFVF